MQQVRENENPRFAQIVKLFRERAARITVPVLTGFHSRKGATASVMDGNVLPVPDASTNSAAKTG